MTGKVDSLTAKEDWNWLWRVHAPPKAKHLLWPIFKGFFHLALCTASTVWHGKRHYYGYCRYEDRDRCSGEVCNAGVGNVDRNNRNNNVWNNAKESGRTLGIKELCHWSEWKRKYRPCTSAGLSRPNSNSHKSHSGKNRDKVGTNVMSTQDSTMTSTKQQQDGVSRAVCIDW
ncbi:hypothetical protein A2U01_0007131 [Trifolium medium]|uniref:Uncharacterized protein n=1 Tax=Trifolium medium TaxID=97028 RepID=A0A392MFJ3_9FABA|nr:hypothetical protein [Trifolium medium]